MDDQQLLAFVRNGAGLVAAGNRVLDLPADNNNDNNNDAPARDPQLQAQEVCRHGAARISGALIAPALGTVGVRVRIQSSPRTSGRVSCARSRDT